MILQPSNHRRTAFSLVELMAVVGILGVLAALIVPRLLGHNTDAKRITCFTQKREIETQCKLWRRNQGSYPAANLSTISGNVAYFPSGVPVCPVDGTAYTINTTTGLVTGHTH